MFRQIKVSNKHVQMTLNILCVTQFVTLFALQR